MSETFFGSALHGASALFLAIATLLALVIWSIKRHRSPKLKIECGASIATLMPSLAGLTLGSVTAGNSVELLENGAFFDLLIERIRATLIKVHDQGGSSVTCR